VIRTAGELLLELRVEELPPRRVAVLAERLATRIFEELMSCGLGPRDLSSGFTRRRLMVCCRGLPPREPDRQGRELGPPAAEAWDEDGRPTAALVRFAERLEVEPEEVERVKTEKGEYAAVDRQLAGRPLAAALSELVPRALAGLVSRGVRWGGGLGPFPRPLRSLLALLDGEVLAIGFAGLTAGDRTTGHPVLSPSPFRVADYAGYRRALRARGILVGESERRAALQARLEGAAAAAGGKLSLPRDMLQRLSLECEIPGVVGGEVDPRLLELPPEIADAALALRPGALLLRDADGQLLPRFVVVVDRPDDPDQRVCRGYERAVAGRLTDLHHLLQADREIPLARRARRLDEQDDGSGLGTWGDKRARLTALVESWCRELGLDDHAAAAREAIALFGGDRDTALVRELPSLAGVVGGLYARAEGYVEAVWQALYDQGLSTSDDAPLPRGPVGQLLAIASRLDELVAGVALAGIPTSRRDPRRLRPLAQGLVRLLMSSGLELDLDLLVVGAVLRFGERLPGSGDEVVAALQSFLLERVKNELGRRGYAYDEIAAATAVRANLLPDLLRRMEALRRARSEPYFGALVHAAKRIGSIVQGADEHKIRPSLLVEEAEQALHATLGRVRAAVDEAIGDGRYEEALAAMAELADAVDRFFADVLVMDEDQERRHNRIALLQSARRVLWRVARLQEMEAGAAD